MLRTTGVISMIAVPACRYRGSIAKCFPLHCAMSGTTTVLKARSEGTHFCETLSSRLINTRRHRKKFGSVVTHVQNLFTGKRSYDDRECSCVSDVSRIVHTSYHTFTCCFGAIQRIVCWQIASLFAMPPNHKSLIPCVLL